MFASRESMKMGVVCFANSIISSTSSRESSISPVER